MSKKIDVYGLSDSELATLRQIAQQRYGKASISLLAKKLLQAELDKPNPTLTPGTDQTKPRITLRLPESDKRYLAQMAQHNHSSINDAAREIIQQYIHQHPTFSHHEATALYQSNNQLLMIGRNINQIARHLNAGESTALTAQYIAELKQFIEQHTEKVGQVLLTHRKRVQK